jgi:hypothetical protein
MYFLPPPLQLLYSFIVHLFVCILEPSGKQRDQPLLWYFVECQTYGNADSSFTPFIDVIAGISAIALYCNIRCKSFSRYVAHIKLFEVVTPRTFESEAHLIYVERLRSQQVKMYLKCKVKVKNIPVTGRGGP